MEPTNESRLSENTESNHTSVSRINPEDLIITLDFDDEEDGDGLSLEPSQCEISDRALRRAEVLGDLAMLAMRHGSIELSDCIQNPIFTEPIALEEAPYLNGDVKTPTPLDPEHVYFGWYDQNDAFAGISYRAHAMRWMLDRFNRSVAELDAYGVQFPNVSYHAIHDEIEAQHNIRCEQNQNAYGRLLRAISKNPSRFTPEHEGLLRSLRAGTASTLERIQLLLDFPEMRGIEDMKDTAIFDFPGFSRSIDDYVKSLVQLNSVNGLRVLPRNNNMRSYQSKAVDPDKGIIIVKSVIADIDNGNERLEVVERRSHCLLPADLKLNSKTDHLVHGYDGRLYNQQLIAGSVYFRTAESILGDDDPEDMSGMLVVNNPLGIGPTLSR
jgi:hypothetical protein